jgi:DNA-binding transcriptional LysR family regulator
MEPGHALSKHSEVRLSECAGYPLILPGWSLTIRPVIENALETADIDIMSVVTSNSIALIKSAVRHRSGVAFLTRIDVGAELLSRRLVFRPIADRRMHPEILSLSVNASRVATPTIAVATETLKAGLSELVARIKR